MMNSRKLALWAAQPCLAAVALVMTGQQALATPYCSTYYCDDILITRFIPMADGSVYIETDGTESSLTCTLYGGAQLTLHPSANDRLFSFLMTAYYQKSRIMIRILEGSSGCSINYAY